MWSWQRCKRWHSTWNICHGQLVSVRWHRWPRSWVHEPLSVRQLGGLAIAETVQRHKIISRWIHQAAACPWPRKGVDNLLAGSENQQTAESTSVQEIPYFFKEPISVDNMDEEMFLSNFLEQKATYQTSASSLPALAVGLFLPLWQFSHKLLPVSREHVTHSQTHTHFAMTFLTPSTDMHPKSTSHISTFSKAIRPNVKKRASGVHVEIKLHVPVKNSIISISIIASVTKYGTYGFMCNLSFKPLESRWGSEAWLDTWHRQVPTHLQLSYIISPLWIRIFCADENYI